jgi:hypothetical protein
MDKICRTCKATKPVEDFYADKRYSDGKATECKPCTRTRLAASNMRPPRYQTPPGTKRCRLCKETKPEGAFYPSKDFHDGLDRTCKACRKDRHDKWRRKNLEYVATQQRERARANPEVHMEYERKKRYGMERGQYDQMLAAQRGRCAICGTDDPSPRRSFAVDHCHDTGKVRALLCTGCNAGIGHFKHSTAYLRSAIKYLEEHS